MSFFIQSRFGNRGNFEIVVPRRMGGLVHFWRNNDDSNVPWYGPIPVTSVTTVFTSASLIQSNFSAGAGPGNLEVVAVTAEFDQNNRPFSRFLHFYRPDTSATDWQGPFEIPVTGLQNGPAFDVSLIQSRFGNRGNFEMIAAFRYSQEFDWGLGHMFRDNDASNSPWSAPIRIFDISSSGSLIQSNFRSEAGRGNLEVVAKQGSRLLHFYRPDTGLAWQGPGEFSVGDVAANYGRPSLIQSRFGNRGNFEVVAPGTAGGLVHFWRNNDDSNIPWSPPTQITSSTDAFHDVSLIQSNFSSVGGRGNLEVIALRQSDNRIFHFFRPDTSATDWQGPVEIAQA